MTATLFSPFMSNSKISRWPLYIFYRKYLAFNDRNGLNISIVHKKSVG